MPSRTVHVTLTYEIDAMNDSMCDALAEIERERWHIPAAVLDADYVVSVVEYPADGSWVVG